MMGALLPRVRLLEQLLAHLEVRKQHRNTRPMRLVFTSKCANGVNRQYWRDEFPSMFVPPLMH